MVCQGPVEPLPCCSPHPPFVPPRTTPDPTKTRNLPADDRVTTPRRFAGATSPTAAIQTQVPRSTRGGATDTTIPDQDAFS